MVSSPLKSVLAASLLFLGVAALTILAAPVPPSLTVEPLTEAEKTGLTQLHRHTVNVFIDSPNFGARRMPARVDDVLTAPKPAKDGDDKKAPAAPAQARVADKAKDPHFDVQDTIGKNRMHILTEDKKEEWKVRKVQLVGLVKHAEPVVYVTDKMPDMKENKDIPTRELDAFEKAALEKIKGGENLKAEKTSKTMRVLGPIYAGQRCVACHEQKGRLLGAFSYELERVPFDPEKERKAQEPRQP